MLRLGASRRGHFEKRVVESADVVSSVESLVKKLKTADEKLTTSSKSSSSKKMLSIPILFCNMHNFFGHEMKKSEAPTSETKGPFGQALPLLTQLQRVNMILLEPEKFCQGGTFCDEKYDRDAHYTHFMKEMAKVLSIISPIDLFLGSRYLRGEEKPVLNPEKKEISVPLIFCRLKSFFEIEAKKETVPLTETGPFGNVTELLHALLRANAILLSPEKHCPKRDDSEKDDAENVVSFDNYDRKSHYDSYMEEMVKILNSLSPYDLMAAAKLIKK